MDRELAAYKRPVGLVKDNAERKGLYSIVRSEDGKPRHVYYFQVNFIDGTEKYINESQKELLVPMLGDPDMKFISVDGEMYATHQITSISRETEDIVYVIGGIKTTDYSSAQSLETKLNESMQYYLPKGNLWLTESHE